MMNKSRRRFLISGVLVGGAAYFGYRFLSKRDLLAKPPALALKEKVATALHILMISGQGQPIIPAEIGLRPRHRLTLQDNSINGSLAFGRL